MPTQNLLVTGRIASGKNTVIERINSNNHYAIIDADNIGHSLLTLPSVIEWIHQNYPDAIESKTNAVNRNRLRSYVFSSWEAMKNYNAMMHPLLTKEIHNHITTSPLPFIVNAALPFELNLLHDNLYIITVSAQDSVIIKRLQEKNIPADLAKKILSHQRTEDWYCSIANRIIENNGLKQKLPLDLFK